MQVRQAYERIRKWYQSNADRLVERDDEYAQKSLRLIRALPSAKSATDTEIQAVFMHVMTNYLEWAYSESDGDFRMYEYVKNSVDNSYYLSDQQKIELRTSRIWPYIQSE